MIDRPDPAPTLGERLDAQARVLIARAGHSFGWTGPFGVLAAHLARLADPADGRFDRIESAPGRPETAIRTIPGWAPARTAAAEPPAWRPTPIPQPQPRAGDDAAPMRGPEVPGRPIPADVRRRIREVAGPGADVMRVHDDGPADAIARAHAADAVGYGLDVYFRQGRLAPDDRRGAALLAHEASHVSARIGRSQAGHSQADVAEEAVALGVEHYLLAGPRAAGPGPSAPPGWPAPPVPHGPVAPAASAPALSGPAPAAAGPSMRAATDRDTGAEVTSAPDLEALRRSLVTELMSRLRTEFERGG